MTHEESTNTMIEVASLAANAASQAIGGCSPGFEPDPEMVEDLLAQALKRSLEGFDGPVAGDDGTRNQLHGALVRFLEG
jgi:hypothetical protein